MHEYCCRVIKHFLKQGKLKLAIVIHADENLLGLKFLIFVAFCSIFPLQKKKLNKICLSIIL